MKKSNYSKERIPFALKRAELGTPISEVCRKSGISELTFYRWKSKHGGMLCGICGERMPVYGLRIQSTVQWKAI